MQGSVRPKLPDSPPDARCSRLRLNAIECPDASLLSYSCFVAQLLARSSLLLWSRRRGDCSTLKQILTPAENLRVLHGDDFWTRCPAFWAVQPESTAHPWASAGRPAPIPDPGVPPLKPLERPGGAGAATGTSGPTSHNEASPPRLPVLAFLRNAFKYKVLPFSPRNLFLLTVSQLGGPNKVLIKLQCQAVLVHLTRWCLSYSRARQSLDMELPVRYDGPGFKVPEPGLVGRIKRQATASCSLPTARDSISANFPVSLYANSLARA